MITIEDDETKNKLQKLTELFEQDLKMPTLSSWENEQFPPSMMFDTSYHLNVQGREIRTHNLKICPDLGQKISKTR